MPTSSPVPPEGLDWTSLAIEEFRELAPPFEAAFHAHMADWRLDGRPRAARRYTTDANCSLPTPEARLLFFLVYLKTYPSKWCTRGGSGWASAKPIRGFMAS